MDQDQATIRNRLLDAPIDGESDPYEILGNWLKAAETLSLFNPNAMVLATSDQHSNPTARVLLLKEIRPQAGLVFYTSYLSPKGQDLDANPMATMNFYWDQLLRQVRVRGAVIKVSGQESVRYWNSRPFASRLSQFVSTQSKVIESRSELENRYAQAEAQYRDSQEVPCPEHWGGYILQPQAWEFWIADPVRFHYRYLFEKLGHGWTFNLLSP